ncbi:STAS domain-containing protein [Luteimicrobium subarcticum]|uniref:Anti-anti-sigma factor n=1 Tax=Luteimicrobium subarcticum TaxID=620910 RepID=A0A2M8WV84_9MICO|nr:STAS domain-containing protein [Luteimicrobium subarcticum]PJI94833.1 anti-anti-sigma factor [Luteimicrobium subarcticum]
MTSTTPTPSTIEASESATGLRVRLSGEIDASLRPQASAVVSQVLARHDGIVVDASAVTFVDSSGMGFVLQLFGIGEQEGRDVVLLDPPTVVLDLLELVGVRDRVAVAYSAGAR